MEVATLGVSGSLVKSLGTVCKVVVSCAFHYICLEAKLLSYALINTKVPLYTSSSDGRTTTTA